jgi:hypothetical protein
MLHPEHTRMCLDALASEHLSSKDRIWLEVLRKELPTCLRGRARGRGDGYSRLRADDLRRVCAIYHRSTHDWLLTFLAEAGWRVVPGARTRRDDLWAAYRAWGIAQKRPAWSLAGRNVFHAACRRGGLVTKHDNDGRAFYADLEVSS